MINQTDLSTPHTGLCGCAHSRRSFLTGAGAALGAGLGLSLGGSAEAAQGGMVANRIDVHHHFDPSQLAQGKTGPAMPGRWDLSRDLDDMARGGVATAMLSWFAPPDPSAAARAATARAINDAGARLVADHPGRFRLLVDLPLPDIDVCLAELTYGLDTLHADGVVLLTNDGKRWLGDPYYDPLFAELNRRRAVVFVHPVSAACCRNLVAGVPDTLIEYGADSTRCIASLIFNGTTTRFPDVRFIFSHGGGATMAVIERFLGGTHGEIVPGIETQGVAMFPAKQPPAGALAELRRLYFDTAQASNAVVLGALKQVMPISQILYGTDYQFQTAEVTSRELRLARVFSPAELREIERGNALRLFPHAAG
ncbi:putative TIM-barrel fold metal-dependent hydrolase [Sphingomonas vulcanisoli]|uniref:TIM-barrel fold metal-dependent hydrolase n=1 Tax=Sphingomonas vulcanisoli TaxID=1658060 RepID=A0ABX0TXY5_9SPHN|nr:amidohydrolase family protein [Sphingomonas vulcanisoli]NIJ09290.1 putative TIM-barrel fold metal-dependent hydrolase [Sphingomonas vulcanisoli]